MMIKHFFVVTYFASNKMQASQYNHIFQNVHIIKAFIKRYQTAASTDIAKVRSTYWRSWFRKDKSLTLNLPIPLTAATERKWYLWTNLTSNILCEI